MAEAATIIGYQHVGPYEARQLSRAEQRRMRAARAATATLKGLHATVNRLDHSIEHYEAELAETRAKIRDRDAREHRSELSDRKYYTLTGVMLALETPVNASVVDFMRLPEWESFVLAVFIGMATALAAKFTGRVLRQKSWSDRGFMDWAVMLVVNIAFGAMIWKVAELRGELAGDPAAGMTALAMQLAAYIVMTSFAFANIDPDGNREQLTRLVAVQEKRLDRLWRERGYIADQYNKAVADAQLSLAEIEHDAIERCLEYRDHNLRRRSEPAPEYFRRPITRAMFDPLVLGSSLDAHPRTIGDVIGRTTPEENDND